MPETTNSDNDLFGEERILRARLTAATALLLPLKLSFTYVALLPAICLWAVAALRRRIFISSKASGAFAPYMLFLAAMLLASLVGIAPLRSLSNLGGFAFFSLTIFLAYDAALHTGIVRIVWALIIGQAIAAAHTVLNAAAFDQLPHIFVGTLTESGQLALVIPVTIGLSAHYHFQAKSQPEVPRHFSYYYLLGLIHFSLLCIVGFPDADTSAGRQFILGAAILMTTVCAAMLLRSSHLPRCSARLAALICFVVPLLGSALLINLKRGPWAGVVVGLLVFLFLSGRRLILPAVVTLLVLLFLMDPVRARLAQSVEHFFISGGRSSIWEVGVELASRFPLGIGYENCQILNLYSREIPPELEHFHSNVLNVLVEHGWIGLALYCWWLLSLWARAFPRFATHRESPTPAPPPPTSEKELTPEFSRERNTKSSHYILRGLGCGLLSWQCAGLVEYNFGDSEVMLLAFLMSGLLVAAADHFEKEQK